MLIWIPVLLPVDPFELQSTEAEGKKSNPHNPGHPVDYPADRLKPDPKRGPGLPRSSANGLKNRKADRLPGFAGLRVFVSFVTCLKTVKKN